MSITADIDAEGVVRIFDDGCEVALMSLEAFRYFRNHKKAMATNQVDFIRASHLCICEHCGKKYIDHPYDETVLGLEDHQGVRQPFLQVLCDGTRVKL